MRILNKFLKVIAMIPIHLLVLLYSWIISFATTSVIATLIGFIWSLFAPLPAILLTKFALVYLLATVPFTLIFFIIIETGRVREVRENSVEDWKKRLRMK